MWPGDPAGVRPMLASIGDVPLSSAGYAFEPKYDGIRGLVAIEPDRARGKRTRGPARVRIWSRLGNEKTSQFPDVVSALADAFGTSDHPVLVDGEIVALDRKGHPTTFLQLQGRIHLSDAAAESRTSSVAFIAFDLLFDGSSDLRKRTLRERRQRLEALFSRRTNDIVRVSEQVVGEGEQLQERALKGNWEGLIAKRLDSTYTSGKRTRDWYKLKLVRQQTCVIGGWTDPRGTRPRYGALLLGVFDDARTLHHVGQVGTGFSDAELERVWKLLKGAASEKSSFVDLPRELNRSHFVAPRLVCEVKFTEWTNDGKLRHPTYLGMRDDVKPLSVRKEEQSDGTNRTRAKTPRAKPASPRISSGDLLGQLDEIQSSGGNGVLTLETGEQLDVTNLGKMFWPGPKLTKGDLFRHYVRVAGAILPVLDDRPLVMKRYPNGVDGKPFFQHRAPDRLPVGVRVANVQASDGTRPHVIGGSLLSLLYTCQLASISQDPWFSRMATLDEVDAIAIDLDPPDGLPFRRVLDMALHVRDELAALGAEGFPKTSGSRGVHIYIPMPPGTPYEAGLLYAQIVATMVARKHPKHATVERAVAARGQRIYVDFMQNMRGKTLASAYSVRANAWAGVSAPLDWDEVESGIDARELTIPTFAARLERVGDLWARLRKGKPANLRAVMKYAEPSGEGRRRRR